MELFIRKEAVFIAAICLAVVLGFTGYFIVKSGRQIIVEAGEESESFHGAINSTEQLGSQGVEKDEAGDAGSEIKDAVQDEIKVYVVGCVKNPGIVTLNRGQLIDDAVRAAGGATEEADLQNINLVYRLKENVMLHIYSKKDSAVHKESGEAGGGIKIIKDSGGAVINDNLTQSKENSKVNINTATASELDTLPGIGEATAADIISYRENNGPFKTIKDIMKVPRIKESRFNSIKDYITVD